MAVIKNKRKESKMEFLEIASKLVKITMQQTSRKFENKDSVIVGDLRKLILEIFVQINKANSLYVRNEKDKESIKEIYNNARANLYAFGALLIVIKNTTINRVKPTVWEYWAKLVNREIGLITGLIKS